MRAPFSKFIPVEQAIIDKEYSGYKTADEPNTSCFCSITYKGNGKGWRWGKSKQEVKNLTYLQQNLTCEETEQWYKNRFDEKDSTTISNLYGLYNNMYDVGDAYHEMWNAWIALDFYEMNECIKDNDFFLVGIAPAPWNVDDIFGEGNTVAFVAEERDTGNRFWCHGSKKWVEDMREQMFEIWEKIAPFV